MRQWYLGSSITDGTAKALDPMDAFLPHLGNRQANATPTTGYPFAYSDDGMAELWHRIRNYTVDCSFAFDGTEPISGDVYHTEGTFAGGMVNAVGASTEGDLVNAYTNGAQGGWGDSFPGHILVTINGTPVDDTATTYGCTLRHGSPVDEQNVSVDRYLYGTEDQMWLPNLWLHVGSLFNGFAPRGNCLGLPIPNTGEAVRGVTATFRGQILDFFICTFDFLNVTSFALEITPVLWWEYEKSDNTDPIWDGSTGIKLRNPVTQVF